jgi:hypothetical protein
VKNQSLASPAQEEVGIFELLDEPLQPLLGDGGLCSKVVEVSGKSVEGRVGVSIGGASAHSWLATIGGHPRVDISPQRLQGGTFNTICN